MFRRNASEEPAKVHLHGVVHDEVHRHQRLDDLGVLAHAGDRRAHCRKVHEQRHTGEVLEDDAGDDEGDFLVGGLLGGPVRQGFDALGRDAFAVAVPQDAFQHDADGNGQFGNGADAGFLQGGQGKQGAFAAIGQREGAEEVGGIHRRSLTMDRARHGARPGDCPWGGFSVGPPGQPPFRAVSSSTRSSGRSCRESSAVRASCRAGSG